MKPSRIQILSMSPVSFVVVVLRKKGLGLLDLLRVLKGRFKQELLSRKVRECRNRGGAVQKEWWSLGVGLVSSWRDIHNNIFELFWRTKASTQVEDGNFRLSTRSLEPQPCYYHPIRNKSPRSPNFKLYLWTLLPQNQEFEVFVAWPCSKHFSTPNSQCFSSFGLTVHGACLGQQKEPLDDIEMRSVCVCMRRHNL